MKILIAGGRDFWDWYTVELALDLAGAKEVHYEYAPTWAASGPHKLAASWAEKRGVEAIGWLIPGESILDERHPDIDAIIAFPGARSDLLAYARFYYRVPVIEVK